MPSTDHQLLLHGILHVNDIYIYIASAGKLSSRPSVALRNASRELQGGWSHPGDPSTGPPRFDSLGWLGSLFLDALGRNSWVGWDRTLQRAGAFGT